MRSVNSKLIGILGAVILHLVIAIVFMSFKLSAINNTRTEQFELEFLAEEEEEVPVEEKKIDLPLTALEKIFQDDQNMLNIAKNLANQSDVNVDPNEYIDMVKDELIKAGLLDENNYIDAQKKLEELEDLISDIPPIEEETVKNEPTEAQKMESNYKGATRIYYDLEGRTHTRLPIPIYLCEGHGQITLNISVNQQGVVTDAKVNTKESTTSDDCLIETAVTTALSSRFNSDINAPKSQSGTLTYIFVAQ